MGENTTRIAPQVNFARVRPLWPPLPTDRNDHPSDRPAHRIAEGQREPGSAPALHRRRDFSGGMADGEEDGVGRATARQNAGGSEVVEKSPLGRWRAKARSTILAPRSARGNRAQPSFVAAKAATKKLLLR